MMGNIDEQLANGKTPISLLQELCSKREVTPQYDLVTNEGAIHEPLFVFKVVAGDLIATGKGQSKKKAKHNAAVSALKLLGATTTETQSSEVGKLEEDSFGNPVGDLQEATQKKMWPPPVYEYSEGDGPPHSRDFICVIKLFNFAEQAIGKSKKASKRSAASAMLRRIRQGNLAPTDDYQHKHRYDYDDASLIESSNYPDEILSPHPHSSPQPSNTIEKPATFERKKITPMFQVKSKTKMNRIVEKLQKLDLEELIALFKNCNVHSEGESGVAHVGIDCKERAISHICNDGIEGNVNDETGSKTEELVSNNSADNFVSSLSEKLSGSKIIVNDSETILNGLKNNVNDLKTIVNGAEYIINGAETIINNSKIIVNDSETMFNGSETKFNGSETIINGAEYIINCPETNINGSETIVNSSEYIVNGSKTNMNSLHHHNVKNNQLKIENNFDSKSVAREELDDAAIDEKTTENKNREITVKDSTGEKVADNILLINKSVGEGNNDEGTDGIREKKGTDSVDFGDWVFPDWKDVEGKVDAMVYAEKFLKRLSLDENFEYDFFHSKKDSSTGMKICLLRLNTHPVTVSNGLGKNKNEARLNAIFNALSQLQILTKRE